MNAIIAAQGFDPTQIIFIVLFLVVGFIQWVFKLWKERREAAERAKQSPPSREEVEARRKAWEEQTRPVQPDRRDQPAPPQPRAVPPPVPATPSHGPLGDLMDTLRRAMDEQMRPPEPVRPQAPPPPLPNVARKKEVPETPARHEPVAGVATVASVEKVLSAKELALADSFSRNERRSEWKGRANKPDGKALAQMLRTTHGYQQAFVLKEILDAPKALQKSPWSMD